MAQIGSLSVKLGLVTVDWDKATTKAKQQAKDLQDSFNKLGGGVKSLAEHFKSFGALGGALGLAALYQETKTLTDEVDDLSKSYGLSISQILAFRGALRDAGGQADSASKVISTLFSKIDDAKAGNDTAIRQFQNLGITFSDLKRMAPYDAIIRVADGFKNITDQFEKTKAIKDFFGKGGIGLTMNDVADALQKGTSQFDDYAKSIKVVGQVSDSVKANMENLKIAFAEVVAPFTTSKVLSIKEFELILRGLGSAALVIGIGAVAGQIVAVAAAIRAATVAGAAFNIMAGGMTPVGIILRAVGVAGAIGAFLYTSAAPSAPTPNDSRNVPVGGGEDFGAAAIMNARPAAAPLPPVVGATTEQAAAARATFAANDPRLAAESGAVSKEASAKQTAFVLSQQMMKIDSQRAAINLDIVNKDTLANELALIRLNTKEKTLQIDSKLAQELQGMKETGSAELKNATTALAGQEKARAIQQGSAEEALASEKFRFETKKKAFEADVEYLKTLGNIGADNEQTTIAQDREAEAARDAAVFAFANQVKDSERLAEVAADRLKFEGSIADKMPEQQTVLLAQYDLEARILDFKREAQALGMPKTQVDAYAAAMLKAGDATAAVVKANQALSLTAQINEAARLAKLSDDRLRFEGSIADKQPQLQAALLAQYDVEANILAIKRQSQALGMSPEQINANADTMRAVGVATADVVKANADAQRTFSFGWDKAFNDYTDSATNAATQGADAFKSMTDVFAGAIDQFVETGTVAWDKLIGNMIKGMLKAEMQRQSTQLFSMGLKFLMSSIGGSSPIPMQPGGGYAAGGDPPVGVPSLVGEEGPEIFVPKVAGTVLPNSFLKKTAGAAIPTISMAAAANDTPTINYNGPYIASLSAIDTQSSIQFLAKNKQAVWATYQSANRSIPMSR